MHVDPYVLVEELTRGSLCFDCGWVTDWSAHRRDHPSHEGRTWCVNMSEDDRAEMCCAAANHLTRRLRAASPLAAPLGESDGAGE